jgi:putative tryptophan/tyrosine transport system substrate-binding protein
MRRRDFIAGLGGATLAPCLSHAQQAGRIYKLGCLIPAERKSPAIAAFFDEMRLNGFVEGRNLEATPDGFGVFRDRIDSMVETILKSAPDAIIAGPDRYTRAFQERTKSIPIVAMSEDLVAEGLIASLARPGGNITGISILSPELDTKRLEYLFEAAPAAKRIAVFADGATMGDTNRVQRVQDAVRARGRELLLFGVPQPDRVGPSIEAAKAQGAGAAIFLASPLCTVNARALFTHVLAQRLPSMHQWPEQAEEGGLIAYGPSFADVFRQRARLVARVLRGAKPAEIPAEQPTKFELAINLKTAKAIGHEVPASLVLRADKVIE